MKNDGKSASFLWIYRKKVGKRDRLYYIIAIFAALIQNDRNRDNEQLLSVYRHIHVYHDPSGLGIVFCVSTCYTVFSKLYFLSR